MAARPVVAPTTDERIAPVSALADEPGRYGIGYQRFRVTGWIDPFTADDGLRVDVTEPMTREQVAFAVLKREGRAAAGESYTRLFGPGLWMSDTPDEYRDHAGFISAARGHVLIHGLGLGCALKAILHKPEVEQVTVVERDPRVIREIGPYYTQDDRVTLVEGDAMERLPGKGERWDVVWHDIWADICTDNLPAMGVLHRRYGRRCDWQGSWSRERLQSLKRRERNTWWA